MSKNVKLWLWSLLIVLVFFGGSVGMYWLCYKFPVFYDALLRVCGGTGNMAPPDAAMCRMTMGIVPAVPFVRGVLYVVEMNDGGWDDDEC